MRKMAEARGLYAERFFVTAKKGFRAESRNSPPPPAAADMRGEEMPEDDAGIGETIRMLRRGGIEQNANRFLRLRAENDDAGMDFAGLSRVAVDVENTAGAVSFRVH